MVSDVRAAVELFINESQMRPSQVTFRACNFDGCGVDELQALLAPLTPFAQTLAFE